MSYDIRDIFDSRLGKIQMTTKRVEFKKDLGKVYARILRLAHRNSRRLGCANMSQCVDWSNLVCFFSDEIG